MQATCESCDRPARARGLCSTHYVAERRRDVNGPGCIACPGCGKATRGSICRQCRRNAVCSVEGCHETSRSRGMCERHYSGIRNRRRRARLASVPYLPYSLADISVRDGFSCGLCGAPVDMSLRFPDSGSPSVDHVTPLSRGGADAPSNVQLAHLGCNSSKGARIHDDGPSNAQAPSPGRPKGRQPRA